MELKVDKTLNITLRTVSFYEGFKRENIVLAMSHLLSVTPSPNFQSFATQLYSSIFYSNG